jgi:NAD(P)H-quinone oxidoreductase subunit 5
VRFLGWLVATLGSVLTLVVANDLVLFAGAWLGTGLALHRLLIFYRGRPQALVAAHKKFLVSRIADGCVFAAIALIGLELNTTRVDVAHAWAESVVALPPTVQVAAVLFELGACIKCAQLPVHGSLIQVMEAPTPVSALLHAGIINLGGFLMMRPAPLMSRGGAAQALLLVVGSFAAVVAALVMTTRISIKVRLAWSTCAQMGFMLVECGLGAYHLALLHLLGHSLYKAHAFLSAGSTVELARTGAATRPTAHRGTHPRAPRARARRALPGRTRRGWARRPRAQARGVERVRGDPIVKRHDILRRLVRHEWLHLYQLDPEQPSIHALRGGWVREKSVTPAGRARPS